MCFHVDIQQALNRCICGLKVGSHSAVFVTETILDVHIMILQCVQHALMNVQFKS